MFIINNIIIILTLIYLSIDGDKYEILIINQDEFNNKVVKKLDEINEGMDGVNVITTRLEKVIEGEYLVDKAQPDGTSKEVLVKGLYNYIKDLQHSVAHIRVDLGVLAENITKLFKETGMSDLTIYWLLMLILSEAEESDESNAEELKKVKNTIKNNAIQELSQQMDRYEQKFIKTIKK